MVKEGIVLSHKIYAKGIEVDRAKVEVIEKLLPPISVNSVRSFLGHAGFYHRFMKDFSKIANPLCKLLEMEDSFVFDEECMKSFKFLKEKLVAAPILVTLDWSKPFEIMTEKYRKKGFLQLLKSDGKTDKPSRTRRIFSETIKAIVKKWTLWIRLDGQVGGRLLSRQTITSYVTLRPNYDVFRIK
ncbi:uncharacterized mitochondrial protein AtMg00860-like [Capsicum annuum]|uniref:uncharacterized mitochondrial protein AtMg00860-like n=1 Tax=Capsicum annuum TaxID=4072 RepID=UPI001FB0DA99|nr:uncharacterized mitochondrial protein AtMg00860-like [Capsicum annuum]